MLSVILIKALVLLALLAMTLFCGLIPLKFFDVSKQEENLAKRHRYRLALSLMNCFAAGVFLSMCMLELLPHARSELNGALTAMGIVTNFPLAEFLLSFGLFLILAIEQFVVTMHSPRRSAEQRPLLEDSHHGGPAVAHNSYAIETRTSDVVDDPLPRSAKRDPSSQSPTRSVILLFALAVHAVFEGLTVGLQTDATQIVQIFAALALHKCVIAFSLTLNLISNNYTALAVLRSSFCFAIASPAGIAAGMVVNSISLSSSTSGVLDGVLESIASGTFLFIVFFEILPHEFGAATADLGPQPMLKVFMLTIGFATITILIIFEP